MLICRSYACAFKEKDYDFLRLLADAWDGSTKKASQPPLISPLMQLKPPDTILFRPRRLPAAPDFAAAAATEAARHKHLLQTLSPNFLAMCLSEVLVVGLI
jgi:hypothetical protein